MSEATVLQEKAKMFEQRADNAIERISKLHYREMAAHYRSLLVEHLDSDTTSRRTDVAHETSDVPLISIILQCPLRRRRHSLQRRQWPGWRRPFRSKVRGGRDISPGP